MPVDTPNKPNSLNIKAINHQKALPHIIHFVLCPVKGKVIVNDDVEYMATVVSMGARTEEIPEAYRNNLSKDHIAAIAVLQIDPGQKIPFWSLVNGMPVVIRFNNWEYEDVKPEEYLMLTTPKGLWVPDSLKHNINR